MKNLSCRRLVSTLSRPGVTVRRLVSTLSRCVLPFCMGVAVLTGCGKSGNKPIRIKQPQKAAEVYYGKLVTGDYEGFVAGMESCDDKPDTYREQMVTLMKQHYKKMEREHGGLQSVVVNRTVVVQDSVAANVFLNVTYKNGSTEEIVQPMVWDGTGWRLQ